MSKFHITKSGRTEPCGATKRACPLGEANHYDSFDAAAKAAITDGFRESDEQKEALAKQAETERITKWANSLNDKQLKLWTLGEKARGADLVELSRLSGMPLKQLEDEADCTGFTREQYAALLVSNITDNPDKAENRAIAAEVMNKRNKSAEAGFPVLEPVESVSTWGDKHPYGAVKKEWLRGDERLYVQHFAREYTNSLNGVAYFDEMAKNNPKKRKIAKELAAEHREKAQKVAKELDPAIIEALKLKYLKKFKQPFEESGLSVGELLQMAAKGELD